MSPEVSVPPDAFHLIPGAAGTLQQQIQAMVSEGIVTGRFRAGERIPSSRGLARQLGISRITVTLAYTELVAGDYLTARGRSGYYVSATAPRMPSFGDRPARREDRVDWDAAVLRKVSSLPKLAKPTDWRTHPFPFIYGQADASLFDHRNWRLCALRALGLRDFDALTADRYEGDDPLLIDCIRRSILPRRGIEAGPDEVLVTLGAQNALFVAAELLLGPGRRAVTENPCYPDLRGVLAATGCAVTAVDVDAGGLPPDAIPAETHVVFTTASHQSPTNVTMPVERRRDLLALAGRDGFLIVEDDYEFEMSFMKSALPSLKSLDTEGRVIHAGSFSKSLFPGLRLGYLVASAPFIREARALRAAMLRHPPGHLQRTLAHFLSQGHYDALLNRMAQAYRRRRLTMDDAIRQHGLTPANSGARGGAAATGFGGSSFWMAAPAHVDTLDLAHRLRAEGVLIEPGHAFFAPDRQQRHFYRLAYSSIAQNRIAEGIARIGTVIRTM
jgi:GntR family transcriptional regulator/MocR family aminotransferase